MIMIIEQLPAFRAHLLAREARPLTIRKYMHDLRLLADIVGKALTAMDQLVMFKQRLQERGYAVRSINSMISAVNHFVAFCGHPAWKLRYLKVQQSNFVDGQKEMGRQDYQQLIQAAEGQGDERLSLLLQTICATGIRVSEVRAISVESLRTGMAEIRSKAKIRVILIPQRLCRKLQAYCARKGIFTGPVFVTRSGRPVDRSNIWRQMKQLCRKAGVSKQKVFPHNLRHLFARCFYEKFKDIVRLADILGHSSVDTTRIYTIKSSHTERQRLEWLGLVL